MPNRESGVEKTKKTPQKRSPSGEREVALDLLHQLFQHSEDGTPLPVLLMRACQRALLDARNSALLAEKVFGVLRRVTLLDALLATFQSTPISINPDII